MSPIIKESEESVIPSAGLRSALLPRKKASACALVLALGVLAAGGLTAQATLAGQTEASITTSTTPRTPGMPAEASDASSPAKTEALTPRMRGALDYAARRYRVSEAALEPVFAVVEKTAREFALDPLLILAVIAVESRFNPFSQSEAGAQGLMQLIPRYHRDKLPTGAGKLPFFDPAINVRVGTMALKDFIRRGGGITAGLQMFAGENADPNQSYSARVLAERDRMEYASRRPRPGAA